MHSIHPLGSPNLTHRRSSRFDGTAGFAKPPPPGRAQRATRDEARSPRDRRRCIPRPGRAANYACVYRAARSAADASRAPDLVAAVCPASTLEAAASNCRTCPNVNARRDEPNVDGA